MQQKLYIAISKDAKMDIKGFIAYPDFSTPGVSHVLTLRNIFKKKALRLFSLCSLYF